MCVCVWQWRSRVRQWNDLLRIVHVGQSTWTIASIATKPDTRVLHEIREDNVVGVRGQVLLILTLIKMKDMCGVSYTGSTIHQHSPRCIPQHCQLPTAQASRPLPQGYLQIVSKPELISHTVHTYVHCTCEMLISGISGTIYTDCKLVLCVYTYRTFMCTLFLDCMCCAVLSCSQWPNTPNKLEPTS